MHNAWTWKYVARWFAFCAVLPFLLYISRFVDEKKEMPYENGTTGTDNDVGTACCEHRRMCMNLLDVWIFGWVVWTLGSYVHDGNPCVYGWETLQMYSYCFPKNKIMMSHCEFLLGQNSNIWPPKEKSLLNLWGVFFPNTSSWERQIRLKLACMFELATF